jgi:hypothetical protein
MHAQEFGRTAKVSRYNKEPNLPVVQLDFNYTYQKPYGLLAQRFSGFNAVGAGVSYRNDKGVLIGFDFSALWGGGIRENGTMDSMIGPSGSLIDNDGNFSVIRLYGLGYHSNVFLGYLFKLHKNNPNSGIVLRAGAGYLQHKIRHQHTLSIVPQLEGEMFKGYDRLTYGFMTTQFLGYQYSSVLLTLHVWGGIELSQGRTYNRRGYNYDTRSFDNELRRDNLIGFKAGIMIPIFLHGRGQRDGSEIYFD